MIENQPVGERLYHGGKPLCLGDQRLYTGALGLLGFNAGQQNSPSSIRDITVSHNLYLSPGLTSVHKREVLRC